MNQIPSIEDIRQAANRIKRYAHRTPVLTCSTLNHMLNMELFFKCENFQKVGAFKFRGAFNTVMSLSDKEAKRGVATHSSGNHAQALALAACLRGIPAYIVMPESAPEVKIMAVKTYGARITFCKPTLEAREDSLAEVVEETGASFVHPYNDYRVIAGQATAALELLEDVSKLDAIIAPIGGGGLVSGTALTAAYLSPSTRVLAAEPAGADDAQRSLKENRIVPSVHPQTIADGLLTSLGDKTFSIIKQYVREIITVQDNTIIQAMRLVWERMKIVVEPSGAVPLAALMEGKVDLGGQRVGVIFSGGNVDLDKLPWHERHI